MNCGATDVGKVLLNVEKRRKRRKRRERETVLNSDEHVSVKAMKDLR